MSWYQKTEDGEWVSLEDLYKEQQQQTTTCCCSLFEEWAKTSSVPVVGKAELFLLFWDFSKLLLDSEKKT